MIKHLKTLAASLVLLALGGQVVAAESPARERLSLDGGWWFHLGDVPFPEIKTHGASYNNAKAGNAGGAAALEYDDSDWRHLDLPHDWAVEGPFDPKENISQGYRPRGIGWYRRYIRVEESERGRYMELQFDGIATRATIWVNGNEVAHNFSGYNATHIDITPYLRYGDALNTIAVRVDANAMEGWWYEGAGIYRHSWLIKTNPVHIISDGIHATPRQAANGEWQLPVAVTLDNSGKQADNVDVEITVADPSGKQIARQTQSVDVPLFTATAASIVVKVPSPQLWSLQQTNLYSVTAKVLQAGKVIDEQSLKTGFRKIYFDAQKGFFLNDQHVKLQGICMHQDHAGVGVAIPDSIWEYRLRRLKELGVNAIRFSHNAPAPEVLDMVDRMGFLVMDENRNFNPSPDYMKQLEWMVRRDRHHPGIILWSVFNEEPVQGTEVGYEMVRRMVSAVKALDDTRPVTAAMNGGMFGDVNVSQAVDVVGFNYQVKDYDRFHELYPKVPLTSSEDTSAFMTRGEYTTDAAKKLIASYDDDFAVWGNSHRDAWEAIAKRDFIAGGFVWTGFDYRGEPTPNEWPSVSSVFGIMDLNGFAKDAYYIHQVQWIRDRPLIYVAPHWNWAGKEGQDIRVMVMTNTERVKLLLNGQEIGEQKADHYRMNYFTVPYAPGKLEAIGFNGDKQVTRATVETTGDAVALQLIPDRKNLQANGRDALPITVQAVDTKGRVVPDAANNLSFTISGAGKSIGHGNGNPNSHEDEKGNSRKLFHGLAQLIVQADDLSGTLHVQVHSPGLKSASVKIPVLKTALVPQAQSPVPISLLHYWRISPASSSRQDPNRILSDNDMNSWGWGQIPVREASSPEGNWRLFRTTFTPREDVANGQGNIIFDHLAGKTEVWLDGKMLGKTDKYDTYNFSVMLPAGKQYRQLTLLVEAESGKPSGVIGKVKIEK